jgi:hypothetical protein
MKTRTQLLVLVTGAALFTLSAVGFDYNEAVQGDIDNHGNNGSLPLFNLDVGVNVIRGTMSWNDVGAEGDDFRFRVPTGTVLDPNSIVYSYEVTEVTGTLLAFGTRFQIGQGLPQSTPLIATSIPNTDTLYLFSNGTVPGTEVTPPPVTLPFFQIIDSSVNTDFPATPLEPGIYWFRTGLHGFFDATFTTSWNYTITLTVTPAP